MNPGPWGMAQTGVPFGEVNLVRDWLGIETPVDKPESEHARRPVQGFACRRSEVSGRRLWGWARETFTTAGRFFDRFFVANYCPLAFFEAGGRNVTPDKLRLTDRDPLFRACDRALRRMFEHLQPRFVIGVGRFAEDRARAALADADVQVGRLLHPSPANPAANRGWAEQATAELAACGIAVQGSCRRGAAG
jgi:single-strand selective monofunctional uracil DNA glycosylase